MSAIDPPDLDTSVSQGAGKIESDRSDNGQDELEEDDFNQPSQWWFASTACPLLAGTFGPMASGFNVCSLAHSWRQTIPDVPNTYEGAGHSIPDPKWAIALNVVSLFAALVANASLLLNMARRVRFSIAQTITITGFLLAGLLLVADMAAMTSKDHYGITKPQIQPPSRHALTQAFYYAIFAAAIYIIIGLLMCLTVYGALRGHYKKDFHLTSSQRTLMLQTMSFIAYLLLGALVYSHIEGWQYLNAVYWADVTLLTVGLGDFSPQTRLGRGLLFPFAIGGILMVGLVVGSIRSLVLERGKEKMSARVMEKRRSDAVHNVDDNKKTIKISLFAKAEYDPEGLSPAQQREEEFRIMRKVQRAAERERRWFSLSMSAAFALLLWLLGAKIFMMTEYKRNWTYLQSVYFSYTSLLTIGYGDFYPESNSGKVFFVFWSLLAVPSLTILISNMGDTIIKWFSDLTNFIGSLTVLPDEGGFRASIQKASRNFSQWVRQSLRSLAASDNTLIDQEKRLARPEYDTKMQDHLAKRLSTHTHNPNDPNPNPPGQLDDLEKDTRFYHYVLARECRNLQKDLTASPPKHYDWADWEYYLTLMGNADDPDDFPGQQHPDILVPDTLRAPEEMVTGEETDVSSSSGRTIPAVDGNVERKASVTRGLEVERRRRGGPVQDWSWLSNASPLMSQGCEAEWLLERLGVALERELNRSLRGGRRRPPVGLGDVKTGGKRMGQEKKGEGE